MQWNYVNWRLGTDTGFVQCLDFNEPIRMGNWVTRYSLTVHSGPYFVEEFNIDRMMTLSLYIYDGVRRVLGLRMEPVVSVENPTLFFSGMWESVWGFPRRLQVPYVIPRPGVPRHICSVYKTYFAVYGKVVLNVQTLRKSRKRSLRCL